MAPLGGETRVYLIGWDVERFQSFLYDLPDEDVSLDDHMRFDGSSRLGSWEPLPVYSDQPNLERPDLWYHTDTLLPVMNKETLDKLEPVISPLWEPLPLTVSTTGETVYMVNVLNVRDALDPSANSPDQRTVHPRFLQHRLPDTGLFLVPQLRGNLFYVERNDDEDTLLGRIRELGLRGMSLLPVWSSSTGPADLDLYLLVASW
jgi:hypothetical protein